MSENTKINLDALMKKSTPVESIEIQKSTEDVVKIEKKTSQEESNLIPDTHKIDIKNEETSTDNHQEAKINTTNEVKASGNRHNLSLASLTTKKASKEENDAKQEALEIENHINAVHTEHENKNIEAKQEESEEKELFGNYESKFTSESKQILKRLRMPKTRIGMLLSLSILCVGVIGVLMLIDPETHSVSNYKTSINSIYNDIKNGKTTELPGESETVSQDINRKNPQAKENKEQTSIENNNLPIQPAVKEINKEEIKKENLKNFLLENYK